MAELAVRLESEVNAEPLLQVYNYKSRLMR